MWLMMLCSAVAAAQSPSAASSDPTSRGAQSRGGVGNASTLCESREPTVHVAASLEDDVLRMRVRVAMDLAPGQREVALWVLPDRLAMRPTVLDEQSGRWLFPREVDRSEVRIGGVQVGGEPAPWRWSRGAEREFAGGDLIVDVPSACRTVVGVELAYRVPERFGRIGRVGGQVTLAAPWYPIPLGPEDASGRRAPMRALHTLRLQFLEGFQRWGASGPVRGSFVPVFLSEGASQTERRVRGEVSVRIHSEGELYRPPVATARGLAAARDLVRVDVAGYIAEAVADAVDTFRRLNLERPAEVNVAIVPSRTELASWAPGWLLVSDRAFEVAPLEAVLSFHRQALRRAVFEAWAGSLGEADAPEHRSWARELRGALLFDVDNARRNAGEQSAADLVGWAGFHPAVDQLLYAPQVAFAGVYFGSVLEPDRFRESPRRARHPDAGGRYILGNVRRVLPAEDAADWSRRVLAGEAAMEALREHSPETCERIAAWRRVREHPVNYRLELQESTEVAEGHRHRLVVHREGAARQEPVVVEVVDDAGNRRRATWEGAGSEGLVEIITPEALDNARVDPDGQLPQSPEVAGGHPLRDDSLHQPWRPPVFQGLTVSYNATEGRILGLMDFSLRRRFDTDSSFGARLSTGFRATGGLVRYTRALGPSRDTNNRVGRLSFGLGLDRLHEGFATDGVGGWRGSVSLAGSYRTLRYALDPRRGGAVFLNLRGSLTRRDGGGLGATVAPSVRGNLTVPLGLRNVMVFVGGAAGVFGDALPGELPGLGGRFFLRGYQSDELVGRGMFFAAVEHRFTPTAFADLHLNALHIAWVREIQLAAFVAGGLVVDALDGRDAVFGVEAGAGVRVHFAYAGIQPGVLVLDFAVPLHRQAGHNRSPLGVLLAFEQYF